MAGGIREYIVPIGQHPDWKEFITRIRLDPTTQAGVDVQVESILFLP
jgi:hypothetical protein